MIWLCLFAFSHAGQDERISRLVERGEYEKAITQAESLLKRDPDDLELQAALRSAWEARARALLASLAAVPRSEAIVGAEQYLQAHSGSPGTEGIQEFLVQQSLEAARAQGTVSALRAFRERFPASKAAQFARTEERELALRLALAEGQVDALRQWLSDWPNEPDTAIGRRALLERQASVSEEGLVRWEPVEGVTARLVGLASDGSEVPLQEALAPMGIAPPAAVGLVNEGPGRAKADAVLLRRAPPGLAGYAVVFDVAGASPHRIALPRDLAWQKIPDELLLARREGGTCALRINDGFRDVPCPPDQGEANFKPPAGLPPGPWALEPSGRWIVRFTRERQAAILEWYGVESGALSRRVGVPGIDMDSREIMDIAFTPTGGVLLVTAFVDNNAIQHYFHVRPGAPTEELNVFQGEALLAGIAPLSDRAPDGRRLVADEQSLSLIGSNGQRYEFAGLRKVEAPRCERGMTDCRSYRSVHPFWLPGGEWIAVLVAQGRSWEVPVDPDDYDEPYRDESEEPVFLARAGNTVWVPVGSGAERVISLAKSVGASGEVVISPPAWTGGEPNGWLLRPNGSWGEVPVGTERLSWFRPSAETWITLQLEPDP